MCQQNIRVDPHEFQNYEKKMLAFQSLYFPLSSRWTPGSFFPSRSLIVKLIFAVNQLVDHCVRNNLRTPEKISGKVCWELQNVVNLLVQLVAACVVDFFQFGALSSFIFRACFWWRFSCLFPTGVPIVLSSFPKVSQFCPKICSRTRFFFIFFLLLLYNICFLSLFPLQVVWQFPSSHPSIQKKTQSRINHHNVDQFNCIIFNHLKKKIIFSFNWNKNRTLKTSHLYDPTKSLCGAQLRKNYIKLDSLHPIGQADLRNDKTINFSQKQL